MFLAVDIGNTNITLALFRNGDFHKKIILESNKNYSVLMYEEFIKGVFADVFIDSCAIASVVDGLDKTIKEACDKSFKINSLIITKDILNFLELDLKDKKSVGIDRLLNTVAAKELYPLPATVVDIGTAITIDVISEKGVFLGGMIMPGLKLQFKSLNDYTSKLPLVEIDRCQKLIGKDTKEAILSGVIKGTGASIDSVLQQIEDELDCPMSIVATGGDCELLSEYSLYAFNYVNPELTLEGIKIIYNRYMENNTSSPKSL